MCESKGNEGDNWRIDKKCIRIRVIIDHDRWIVSSKLRILLLFNYFNRIIKIVDNLIHR